MCLLGFSVIGFSVMGSVSFSFDGFVSYGNYVSKKWKNKVSDELGIGFKKESFVNK